MAQVPEKEETFIGATTKGGLAMLNPQATATWAEAGVLLVLLVAAGFLTSWIATDALRMTRGPYIAVLTLVTVGAVGVIAWRVDLSLSGAVTHHWQAGLIAGLLTGIVLGAGMRRMPAMLPRSGRELHTAEVWEGVVYGLTEGILLSGLPVFVAWQAATDAGWGDAASWASALTASAVMIAIHHFGYWDFRGRQVLPALAACLVLSVAYLATGSLIAPALGHVVLHLAGIIKGVQLPPHPRVVTSSA